MSTDKHFESERLRAAAEAMDLIVRWSHSHDSNRQPWQIIEPKGVASGKRRAKWQVRVYYSSTGLVRAAWLSTFNGRPPERIYGKVPDILHRLRRLTTA